MKKKINLPIEKRDMEALKKEFQENFPKQIKKFRTQNLGWTLKEMSSLMGITFMSLWNKEHGRRTFTAFEMFLLEEIREDYNSFIAQNGK